MPDIDAVSYRSPNYTEGRSNGIQILVIHATAGNFKNSVDWLIGPHSEVSTHYVIAEDGRIFQLVHDMDTAWHAGRSKWGSETSVNDASLGIELVNSNSGYDPYEVAQVDALVWLVEFKAHQYGINIDNIVRHLDVAIPEGRKTDPAGFDWVAFKRRLTLGSSESVWALWGVVFPLYPDTRHFGIPQAWYKAAKKLGEARSSPVYNDDLVIQVFERGVVLYRDGKSKVVLDSEIGVG